MAKNPFNFNFDKMSLSELAKFRDQIESWFSRKIVEERKALQSRIDALSAMEGGTRGAGHISARPKRAARRGSNGGKNHPLKGRKAAAKYRGPNGETWAGRGLKPRWLTALERRARRPSSS